MFMQTWPKRSLSDTLDYSHPQLLLTLQAEFGLTAKEAQSVFRATKEFLWLSVYNSSQPKPVPFGIERTMGAIDHGWHTFVLYTEDYFEFCQEYLGVFVHHVPCLQGIPLGENHPQAHSPDDFRQMLHLVGTILGQKTLHQWMIGLPAQLPQLLSTAG